MPAKAKLFVNTVLVPGTLVLAACLWQWSCPNPRLFLIYLGLALLASLLKLRLPGLTGTYSLNFVFILIGIVYFTLPEALIAGCAGALVQSIWNAKQRPALIQILFNIANLTLTIALCFFVARDLLAAGLQSYRAAVMALVASLYFVVNTLLVSGVLSLLQGKRLREVCQEWYLWSFPYYMVGAAVVALLPVSGRYANPESWLILMPPLYLVHFYCGLSSGRQLGGEIDSSGDPANPLTLGARLYLLTVIGTGLLILILSAAQWEPQQLTRFLSYLVLAVMASGCKVRLPGMTGTVSVSFVLILVAIAALSFFEAAVISAIVGVVQCLWRSSQRPKPIQVWFNLSLLVTSTAFAYGLCRVLLASMLGDSLIALLMLATAVLYSVNTIMVSAAVCLVEKRPLLNMWRNCYFWSFPYYLVGAAAAGVMIVTNRVAGWQPSILILPMMALIYISYRVQVGRAVRQTVS